MIKMVYARYQQVSQRTWKNTLGYSVSCIPDPFGCHESYGKHMSSLLLDALINAA